MRIDDEDLSPERFAAAVAARARARPPRSTARCEEGDLVTQFEALTAAAYGELADAGVEVAVIEAGLGGRWDATNVLPSRVQVLTNVGLEHTRWLGPTIADIAAEKLDIVRPGGTLVVGAGLHPDALALAEQVTAERGARLVVAPRRHGHRAARRGRAPAAQLRRRARRGRGLPRASSTTRRCAPRPRRRSCPGASRSSTSDPATVLDGAHNPAGMAALAASLRAYAAGRRVVACVSVLEDKDAAGMLRELLPAVRRDRAHRQRQPARAAGGDAGVAVRPARRPAGAHGRPDRAARWRPRARPRGPTASRWPPARST